MVNDEYSARFPASWLVWCAALLVLAVVVTGPAAWRHWREAPAPAPAPVRASWSAPDDLAAGAGADFPFGLALAPDGRRVAFPASREGRGQLWVHDLRSGATEAVPGTEGAVLPFWSPDGGRLGFFAGTAIKSLDLETSRIDEIMTVEAPRGAAWNARGDLVIAAAAEGGLTLRTAEGTTRALTSVDSAAGELGHAFPAFLPGGAHVVFFVRARDTTRQGVWVAPLGTPDERQRLVGGAAQALVAGNRLLYANDGALVTQALDTSAWRLTGRATVLGVHVGHTPIGQLLATASDDALIYSGPLSSLRELVWVSRTGERRATLGSPADIWSLRIAPDGRRVAATVLDPLLRTLDVVLFDGRSLMPTRVSLSIDADESPVWSPDGLRLAWVAAGSTVMVRGAGAVLPAETLARFDEPVRVTDWTPDGSGLIVSRARAATREDLFFLPVSGTATARALVETPFADVQGTVSPDGRWLAYASDESGRLDVYVEALRDRSPEPVTRERVTSGGGSDPRWSSDGRELFFRRGSEIHAATPALGRGQNAVAATSMLFDTKVSLRTFDAARDGQSFLLNVPAGAQQAAPATVVMHWPRE